MRLKSYFCWAVISLGLWLFFSYGRASTQGLPILTPTQKALLVRYNGYYDSLYRLFPEMDETQRIKLHLSLLEKRLRSKDISGLPPETRKNRAQVLDLLHDYWVKGQFPRNFRFPGKRTPEFIGDNGVVCAFGYLVQQTAGEAVVEDISHRENQAYVMEMKSRELNPWLSQWGISKEEAAMVQPSYCFSTGPTPTPVSQPLAENQPTPCLERAFPLTGIMAVDSSNNLVVAQSVTACGSCAPQIGIFKYNSTGTLQWGVTCASGLGGSDWANSVAIDAGGNILVAGGSNTINAFSPTGLFTNDVPSLYRVLKCSSGGAVQWSKTYPASLNPVVAPNSVSDQAYGVATDSGGNAYVIGFRGDYQSDGVPSPYSIYTTHLLQYSSTGTLSQDLSSATDGGLADPFVFICLDNTGNIYLGGTAPGGINCPSYLVRKYDSGWNKIWASSYYQGGQFGFESGLVCDNSGNAYACGNLGTIRVNGNDSNQVFADNISGSTVSPDIAMDGNGKIYVGALISSGTPSAGVFRLAQYDPSTGLDNWYLDYPDDNNNPVFNTTEIAVDSVGSVYLSVKLPPEIIKYSFAACGSITPTMTSTPSPTATPTFTLTPTFTPTVTPTFSWTATYTSTPTPTPSWTSTWTPTLTPTATVTNTPTITRTPTITPTPTPRYPGNNPPGPGDCFIYPSPARGDHATLSYYMAEPGAMKLKVWNEKAELVNLVTDEKPAGIQVTPFSVDGFATGIYLYTVELSYDSGRVEKIGIHKFVILH